MEEEKLESSVQVVSSVVNIEIGTEVVEEEVVSPPEAEEGPKDRKLHLE